MAIDLELAGRRLDEETATVQADLAAVRGDRDDQRSAAKELSHVDQHPADLGTETFDMEESRSLEESFTARLRELQAAKRRLEDGTYGRCERCGQPIEAERLEAVPSTRFCARDELLVEREAAS